MPDKIGKIDYPISEPEEFKKNWNKKIELYGITGWFACDYGEGQFTNQATAFGGYFKLENEGGTFDGEIVDMWGSARIAGSLNDGNLYFNKIYVNAAHVGACRTLISYTFSKPRNSKIWKGKFVITYFHPDDLGKDLLEITKNDVDLNISPNLVGRSNCIIYPVFKNAYGIMGGPMRIER